jgi:hypothetical protein
MSEVTKFQNAYVKLKGTAYLKRVTIGMSEKEYNFGKLK